MRRHRLLGSRIASALFAGAAVGGATVAVAFNLPYMLEVGRWDMLLVAMTFIVAFMAWLLGLAVVGAPLWSLAERMGYRSFHHAISAGLAATFLTAVLLACIMDNGMMSLREEGRVLVHLGRRTPYGLWVLARDCGLFALAGGLVAAVIWRVAYRREVEA